MRKLITAYLLEHTQHGENYLASLGDAALRVKLQDLRAAHGYTRTGVLAREEPLDFPELDTVPAELYVVPAPRGWDKIEAGLEAGQVPALLKHQAA